MSLFERMMTDCVRLERAIGDDGEGGRSTAWKEGDPFRAAITFSNSVETRKAEKDSAKSLYTVTVPVDVILKHHDVFKRCSDGKVFRAISDGDDSKPPAVASFQFRQFSAEEWELIN